MSRKLKEILNIQDAMDNLASIAEIDMEHPPRLGVVSGGRLVTDEQEFPMGSILWLSEEGDEPILEVLDQTYRAVYQHFLSLYENPQTDWESNKTENGIAAMMALVGESADKMDRYLAFRSGKNEEKEGKKIALREAFKTLQQFYMHQLMHKFGKGAAGGEEEAWAQYGEAVPASTGGLKDFEMVRADREYELFYIRNEEGDPYFNHELLRSIKLTVDLGSADETFEEDPLLKVRAMQDRDLQSSANQILGECYKRTEELFKSAKKWQDNELARLLSRAVMALFLAANGKNLLQNTSGKSCLQYFSDFIQFLRAALKTAEYQKWIAYPPEQGDKMAGLLLHLAHDLCAGLFLRVGGIRQEAVGLIHRVIRRGVEIFQGNHKHIEKGETVWNQFLLDDEWFRALLAKFPNGPLFKILDVIREEEQEDRIVPFDPIMQDNLPIRLYQVAQKEKTVHVVRIPSPVRQMVINKCEVIDEFRGFLRSLDGPSAKRKHLIVNLNDRTIWREFARSRTLENLHVNAEFCKSVFVITLPKGTDFYYQNNEYLHLNDAKEFIEAFKAQLGSPEECGFFFPSSWKLNEILRFSDTALHAIHEHFFQSKKNLTRRNREDFIEIFYQFLVLKAMEQFHPDSISFTCKDAIDIGSAQAAAFYGFLKCLHGSFEEKAEKDFLLWLFYMPALFIRERGVDSERLNRSLSILERFDTELGARKDQIIRAFECLYAPKFFNDLGVNHL